MGNPSYILKLGIDEADLARGLQASEEGFQKSQEKAKLLAAEMALLEQRMASGKTEEMAGQYKTLTASLREARDEATAMGKQLRALEAIKPPAVAADDESARYEAHMRKIEEAERGRRAQAAADTYRLAMPAASGPNAAVQIGEEAAGAAAGRFAIGRMGKMELGHVARSLAGSAAAGVPLADGLMMEAPRLLQALGPALGALLPIIAVLAPALAGLAVAASVHKANNAARSLRRETGRVDSLASGSAAQYEEAADEAEKQVLKVREARKKRGMIAKIFGAGTNRRDESGAEVGATRAAGNLDESLERQADRERREFNGDPQAARDKIAEERDAKIAAARNKHRGDDPAARRYREALISKAESDYTLDLERHAREEANRQSDIDAAARDNYERGRGGNMPVIGAQNRANAAKEKLDHGPELGPEHDENANRADAASMDAEDAARKEKNEAAAVAAEQKILQIKREGLDVDIRIAQQRLAVAQGVLDNSREKTGAAYEGLKLAVDNAKQEVIEAKKATAERHAQAEIEQRIAGLRGSSDQVRQGTLELERKNIARQMFNALGKPDEFRNLTTDLARNRQQQAEFDKAKKLRDIDIAGTEDHAHLGRGPEAQAAYLEREKSRVEDRRKWNQNENGNDREFNAGLDDKLHELTQALRDLTFAEEARMTQLANEKTNIGRRGYEATQSDKDSDTDRKFDREKKEAQHRGASQAELDAIEANRAADHEANAADEAGMTPEQKLARMRHNDARDREIGKVQSAKARHDEAAAANGGNFDAYFHGDSASGNAVAAIGRAAATIRVPNRIKEIKDGAANAGKGDGNHVDNQGIISAINHPAWVDGAFKNRG